MWWSGLAWSGRDILGPCAPPDCSTGEELRAIGWGKCNVRLKLEFILGLLPCVLRQP